MYSFFSEVLHSYASICFNFLNENWNMILPVFAAVSVVMLVIGKIYFTIRIKFPTHVNCWFCNSKSSVPYNSSNCWYCSHCDQYNGFCPDGSYNRILTEQFNEKLNFGSWCLKIKQKKTNTNGLCRFCNINLELKVRQLAQFVPLNPANYDEEVTLYSEQLERVYRLCSRCQGVLDKTLAKKQELYVNSQHQLFTTKLHLSNCEMKKTQRHPLHLAVTSTLSVCMLLSTIPSSWLNYVLDIYLPFDQIDLVFKPCVQIVSTVPDYLVPSLGAGVQLTDVVLMRDVTSLVNMFLWTLLLMLPLTSVKVDYLILTLQILVSVVLLITSLTEAQSNRTRSLTTQNPVQFHKLDMKQDKPKSHKLPEPLSTNVPPHVSVCNTPAPTPVPDPSLSNESAPEDLGFSKLNVSSRRITRSQSKPFQAKNYTVSNQNDLFRPKLINLSSPKLQVDKHFEYQVPMTRCSSQSSGFVSLSHHKDYEEDQAPSIIDNLESISQYGGGVLAPYHSPIPSSIPFPQYSPFSQFHPYAVMHFTPNPFEKVYSCANTSFYEPSLNLSSSHTHNNSWFQFIKNTLSSLLFMILITSNFALLWKVFGEEYFKIIEKT